MLLIEHYLEFLSLKGGCADSSESTLVKMPHCWKSHVSAHVTAQIAPGASGILVSGREKNNARRRESSAMSISSHEQPQRNQVPYSVL